MTHRRKYVAIIGFTLILTVAALWWNQRYATTTAVHPYHHCTGDVWTTSWHVTHDAPAPLPDSITAVLQAVDRSASAFNDSSLLQAFNRSSRGIVVDSLLRRLYLASMLIHVQSGGAYDPTVMPLVDAWGFGRRHGTPPTQRQIDSLLTFVGLNKTALHADSLTKRDPRTQIDFSSIAKGLAADEIGRMLLRNGARNFLVEIGGEVVARGVNEDRACWHVGVDLPSADSLQHAGNALTLMLDSCAVATSGNYRRYLDSGGQRISHIINPRTGSSTASNLLSVTIVAPTCMEADGWATAAMVLGDAATKRLLGKRSDLGVLTICATDDGSLVVWSNKRLADLVATR